MELLVFRRDGVVDKVHILVVKPLVLDDPVRLEAGGEASLQLVQRLLRVVVLCHSETAVAVVVEPDGEGVPVCNEDPLPHVKLSLGNREGILHVLLHDPLFTVPAIFGVRVLEDLPKILESGCNE